MSLAIGERATMFPTIARFFCDAAFFQANAECVIAWVFVGCVVVGAYIVSGKVTQ